MRAVRHRIRGLWVAALGAATLAAAPALADHDPSHAFSGNFTYTTQDDARPGTISLRAVDAAAAEGVFTAMGALPGAIPYGGCAPTAADRPRSQYYVGRYHAGSGEEGRIAGCVAPGGSFLFGWYRSDAQAQPNVAWGISFSTSFGSFAAPGEANPERRMELRFAGHFPDDGAGAATLPPIETTPEYQTFLGLNDPDRRGYRAWVRHMMERYLLQMRSYYGIKSMDKVPGETRFGKHSDLWLLSGNDLFELLGLSIPPNTLATRGNVFARTTRAEADLRKAIERSRGNLLPGDVVVLALMEVGQARYPLAVLTAHNLLKQVALTGREAIRTADDLYALSDKSAYARALPGILATLRAQNRVLTKLQSLRRNPDAPNARDKIGPWYHAFAILTMGALRGANEAKAIVAGEHTAKWLGLFQGEGGLNREKRNLDICWSVLTGHRVLERLDRTYTITPYPAALPVLCYPLLPK
ncbi:MAG: hypothetical protein AB1416_06845 [Actinomycetota bacterium]